MLNMVPMRRFAIIEARLGNSNQYDISLLYASRFAARAPTRAAASIRVRATGCTPPQPPNPTHNAGGVKRPLYPPYLKRSHPAHAI